MVGDNFVIIKELLHIIIINLKDDDHSDDLYDEPKRVLSISLTSSWQNCNLTKDFTFISSQHVSSSSLLFTWWFKNDRQYFPKNKRCRNPLSPESESGDKRLVIWVLKTGPQWGFSSLGQPGHLSPPPNLLLWFTAGSASVEPPCSVVGISWNSW